MNAAMASIKLSISISPLQQNPRLQLLNNFSNFPTAENRNSTNSNKTKRPTSFYCSDSNTFTEISQSETEGAGSDNNEEDGQMSPPAMMGSAPPVRRRRRRYRKQCPGENNGITEEMRFVAMKLRNSGKPRKSKKGISNSADSGEDGNGGPISEEEEDKDNDGSKGNIETWQPSMEGFLKYLVDSKLVFSTIERIVDESSDVSCKLSFLLASPFHFLC